MTTRTLILGSEGFLGSRLARTLAARGTPLRLFDLRVAPIAEAEVDYVEGNLFNDDDLRRALDGVDTVLYFASMSVPASSANNAPIEIETNVLATVRLLQLMASQGVTRLGYPSSGGTVYADSIIPHVETEALRPTSPYGLGKVIVEQAIHYFGERHGLSYQIWRIANPYGDETRAHTVQGVIDAFLHRIAEGKPVRIWGNGTAVRDFMFVDDVVMAIATLLETAPAWGETVNIGTGRGVSLADILEIMREETSLPVSVESVTGYAGTAHAVLNVEKLQRLTQLGPPRGIRLGIREAWRRRCAAGMAPRPTGESR
jgi:UDP-glucose 4-epimerase